MAAKTVVAVRLDADMIGWLQDRADRMHLESPGNQARAELALWRDLLAVELRRIRLTLSQALCIADVLNGHLMSPAIGLRPGLVYAECYDAFEIANDGPVPGYSSYGKKWGIHEKQLLDYLAKLAPAADHALLDAFSRWWNQENSEESVEGFAKVGLTILPDAS